LKITGITSTKGGSGLKVAFVAGLSDKKIKQKLAPLALVPEIKEIHLYRRNPLSRSEKVSWQPLPVLAGRSRLVGDMLRFLCLMVRGHQYDIVIGCNQAFHGLTASLCGIFWNKPVVQIVTSGIEHICSQPLLRRTLLSAQAVAVRGPISLKQLQKQGYKKHIAILHNPWDLGVTPTDVHDTQSSYDILAVGNYATAKSYPWMMEVIGTLKKKYLDLRVAVAGKGPFQQKLSPILNQYNLRDSVSFLGWQDEDALAALYRKSRLLLLTSHTEGLPMVVIEAMSHKKPVFVTDVGDLAWLVREGRDGKVVPYGQTQKMASQLLKALRKPETLHSMGQSAHGRILSLAEEFEPTRISTSWQTLIRNALRIKSHGIMR